MKTKYQQIADELRSKILANEYPLATVIPPELQLQKDYEVSRHTVRQAIALLVNEGYLRKEKGSGTYVDNRYQTKNAGSKKTIGVITTYLSDYIFPSIIRGIEQGLREAGYSLLLASTNNNTEQERECLEMMLNHGVDGLIVEPTRSNQYNPNLSLYLSFKERQIPVVMLNAFYEELEFPHLCVDDTQAGFLATNHLLEKGHEALALITKIDDLQGKYRMKGFIKAHEANQRTFHSEAIFTYTTETKAESLQQVLATLTHPENELTGIVCYNDEIASWLVEKLLEEGYQIPQDFSIVGEDDSFLSRGGEVKLTTISHPKEKMGLDAAAWIVQAVETKRFGPSVYYSPKLIQRDSVEKK